MSFKRKSAAIRLLTGALTLCVIFSAVFVGIYPVASAADNTTGKTGTYIYDQNVNSGWYLEDEGRNDKENPAQAEMSTHGKNYAAQAERYYEADSLPLFQITFSRLNENAQKAWLEKLYADGDSVFFSVAVRSLNADVPLLSSYAEKAYSDGKIAFFSTLTDCMDRAELEFWLDRALEDDRWNFQSMLFDKLDMDDEKDAQEKVWAEQQIDEYQAAGVTMDGKNYYYQGKLVNIFLDIRANNAFYALDMNPLGTVNIKIIRDADDKITGAAYMTEAEVTELLEDMDTPDEKIIPVDFNTAAAGETIFLGEYTLSDGDEILYDISVKTGNRIKVFFAKDEQEDVIYWSVDNLRQPGEPLECIADFIVGPPTTKPGTYKLYLQAPDSALGNVRGSVSIAPADAS